MWEVCFCGREGELTDRAAVVTARGPGLACPTCGHVDHLRVLGGRKRLALWAAARERDVAAVEPDRALPSW